MSNGQKKPKMKPMSLTVSMDGLRRNLARSYNDLVETLAYAYKHDHQIDREEIAEHLRELRQDIAILHCVYDEKTEQFSNLTDEIDKILIPNFKEP